jgi:diguanylate cyclase (GGDEF)-like protein/PAS domain S-box-containing protein
MDSSAPIVNRLWAGARAWQRFRQAHLHDYNAQALRFWLAVLGIGALALAWSLAGLAGLGLNDGWQVLGWANLAILAAAFPIQIPRSKHSIATGDVVIFLLLALHGAAAATAAAALEAYVASRRTSARVSSHLASTAAGATAMALGGALFELSQAWLAAHGVPHAAAHMAALGAAALVHFSVSTMTLMQVICLKRGQRLNLHDWLGNTSWVGTLYLISSVLAGLLSLNAQQFGRSAAAVGVGIIGLSLVLLRAHFSQQVAQHEAQEARVVAAELEAEQNQKRFHAAFTHASIGMAIVSLEGKVLQVNQALCVLVGLAEKELLGHTFRGLLHRGDAALLQRHVDSLVARRDEAFSIELRCRGVAHSETWVSLHCAPYDDQSSSDGAGLIYQLHDISSRRRAEGELHHVAYHDSLTDLANRNCFQERLRVAVERSRVERRFRFAVMYLDLDRFKLVNDSLGHPAGDELLREVARRLSECVRPRDLVARLGGDEFAVLLEQPNQDADVLALGERVLQSLERPVSINGTELRPQASIGVTFSDLGYREPDELLRDADLAMYKAKADGKARLALFDASLHEQLGHKLQLEADLRRAIGEGQLSLVYQPLYRLQPHRLDGFEALARWVHPTRGAIPPGVFIALAEETGCIEVLTQWALDEAIRQHAAWVRDVAHGTDLVMHVNVSGKDLSRPHLVPHIRAALQRHALPPRLLVLEITESTLMEHREMALSALAELSELGVKLGIDDFGTGYSSLAYLSTLPFDCLKIDRSFVIGMDKSPQNLEIVRTVITLGRTLNKQVVAEGIETKAQLERLRQLGATIGQGYLLSRPLDAIHARALLHEGNAVSA